MASEQLDAPIALPRERTPVTIDLEAQWASQPVWAILEKLKSLSLKGIRAPNRLARS